MIGHKRPPRVVQVLNNRYRTQLGKSFEIMLRSITLTIAIVLFSASCDQSVVGGVTEVRVENQSSLTFTDVEYYAGNNLATHPSLEPGRSTPYVTAEIAYGYTTVQVVVEGDTLRMQVIDYFGESPLDGGRYTYVLSVDGPVGGRSLRQELRRDW